LRAADEAAAVAVEAAQGVVLDDGCVGILPQASGVHAGIEAFPSGGVRLLGGKR
jgi:hypothetical protein